MKFILALSLVLFCNLSYAQQLTDCTVCNQQKITKNQIKSKSADEIRLLVNEIYARHGYRFKDYRYQDHFESFNWYKVGVDNQNIELNNIEKQNIALFQQQISELTSQRSSVIQLLKNFKTAFLSSNSYDLKTTFNFKYSPSDDQANLATVLEKINLNDINWYKNNGLYEVVVDNGYVKTSYALKIVDTKVYLSYNYMSHSEIMEEFDIYTTYRSETEHYMEWSFEWYNGELKFMRFNVAG